MKIWLRSFDIQPPPIDADSHYQLAGDRRYAGIEVPQSESLKDTIGRVLPYYEAEIVPALLRGERVMVSAHGNSLRALEKHLSNIADSDIVGLEIPTGQQLVYQRGEDLTVRDRYYLSER